MTTYLPGVACSGAGKTPMVGGEERAVSTLGNVDSLFCSCASLDRRDCRFALASIVLVGHLQLVFGIGLEINK